MNKKEILEICDKHNIVIKKRLLEKMSGKDLFKMTECDWLKMFKYMGRLQKMTIGLYRAALHKFYNACVNEGLIMNNPFDSKLLSSENISYYLNKDIYISPSELKDRMEYLKNETVGRCIISMFYEGVKNAKDLYDLKLDQIDLASQKIYFKDFTLNISTELCKYIKNYNELLVYKISYEKGDKEVSRDFLLESVCKDSFAKIIPNKNTSDSYKAFINMCNNIIVKQAGMTVNQLYNSGFMNFIYKECDCSLEELEELFSKNKAKSITTTYCDKLEEYGKKYGVISNGATLRYRMGEYYKSFLNSIK